MLIENSDVGSLGCDERYLLLSLGFGGQGRTVVEGDVRGWW